MKMSFGPKHYRADLGSEPHDDKVNRLMIRCYYSLPG